MKILLLGPGAIRLGRRLAESGDTLESVEESLAVDDPRIPLVDLAVSYGYRHILRPAHLTAFRRPPINLHVSLLPWNRGADPNFWSFVEETPKGVSIHEIDAGVDTGPILAQRVMDFSEKETLKTSYARLTDEIERLLLEKWPEIRSGRLMAVPQPPDQSGSVHRLVDKEPLTHLLRLGWDTPVTELIGASRRRI